MASSPTVARWELARRIRDRRRQLGIDVKTVAGQLDFSRNYWSAVENDRTILSEDKLRALTAVLDFDAGEVGELLDLRDAAKERGWWDDAELALDETMKRFYGLEDGARRIRTYENLLITGLLQTEEYARVIVSSDPGVSDVGVDRLVEVRMRRQDRLTSSGAVALTAIMSQAALLQQIGGPGVLYRQLVSLVRISEARPDGIEIRVIPFTMTPGGLIGSSTLYFLEFASSHLTTVAWQESMLPIGIIEDPNLFRNLSLSYEQALEASLSRGESLELIQRCAQELKPLRHRGST
jgi:transcriptional regulator with XRE-family HTH domain